MKKMFPLLEKKFVQAKMCVFISGKIFLPVGKLVFTDINKCFHWFPLLGN